MDDRIAPVAGDIPAAPWHLSGSACFSLWRVEEDRLPYPGADIGYASLGGKALVVTFWASYDGEGTRQYNELAVGVVVRGRGLLGPSCTVSHIWVDDDIAMEGGRRLWGIPKQTGVFAAESDPADRSFAARLSAGGEPVAALQFEAGLGIPGQPRVSGFLLQPGSGGPQRTRCSARGRLLLGKAGWDFAPDGPLAFLSQATPFFSGRILRLQGWFGI